MSYLTSALILQLICIPSVIFIFKYWEKIPASFIATALFLIVGSFTAFVGIKTWGFRGLSLWGALQFLIFFALPIALMRVMSPDQELGGLHLGPLSAASLHRYSNLSFILMLVLTLADAVRMYRRS